MGGVEINLCTSQIIEITRRKSILILKVKQAKKYKISNEIKMKNNNKLR